MKRFYSIFLLACLFCLYPGYYGIAAETVFANYFDILVNSGEGTEVTGRIHLERNKDVLTNPIPKGYRFEILKQSDEQLFDLETRYDLSNRIMGVLTVGKNKNTGAEKRSYPMTIALKDGDKLLKKFKINVRIVKKTLWEVFYDRYTPATLQNKRLYGRIKYTDAEVAALIKELKENNGRFKGYKCYTARPQDYKGHFNSKDEFTYTGTIEYDWEKVVNQIGGLGYAYATSKVYGPKGSPEKRKELREALYQAILAHTTSVPVEGTDILIDGKPIGNCTGDGFSLLQAHRLSGIQIPTHQWTLTDGLVVPILHLMPDLLKGMEQGDENCLKVHDTLIRYMQLFFSEIESRRPIDNPDGRWGELQDTLYSSGAWADANLGHRSRTMLALPIIWADYNRPMTYVQYWYKDFYKDKPFKGFSFQPGWSPHGVVADLQFWMTKYDIPAHHYIQSGFQPDGTVSHHTGHGTDIVMVAYGFEWLTDCTKGYNYLKNTKFKIPDEYYQFQADRLLNIYPKMFYKQRMDFLATGRSFRDDLKVFVTHTYTQAVEELLQARSRHTQIEGAEDLQEVCRKIKNNTLEYSGTDAYWVQEYLVHRRGAHESPFFASLKLKSERTVGAEDFSKKVRKSWHMGYGILPVKVTGDEYSDHVLANYDWHALPGLTEEWRTDAMPLGHSQASLPGLNKVSGVLADGKAGMGIYHHLPQETYSSATAYKSYHFIDDCILSTGSAISRLRPGQQKEITTFIDQTSFKAPLTICINGKNRIIQPNETVDIVETITAPCWLHCGQKGYLILPTQKVQLRIQTGGNINVTDKEIADGTPGFIIALNHGVTPGQLWDDSYTYIQLPNVTQKDMPARFRAVLADLEIERQPANIHAVYSAAGKTWQYAFFKPGSSTVGNYRVTSDDTAEIMLRDNGNEWVLSVNNPMPDGIKQTLTFHTDAPLAAGTYTYRTKGIYPLDGETVTVTVTPQGERKVVVELPDIRDAQKYNYQSDLYAATPICVNIPK